MTTLEERLRRALDGLPDEAAVTWPVGVLRGWLAEPEQEDEPEPLTDFTCQDVAEELGRSPSTVRGWCADGDLPGAYRLNGREWRIPRASLRRYLDAQARDDAAAEQGGDGPVDLGGWRRHYRTKEAGG